MDYRFTYIDENGQVRNRDEVRSLRERLAGAGQKLWDALMSEGAYAGARRGASGREVREIYLLDLAERAALDERALIAERDHLLYLIERTRDDLSEALTSQDLAYVENAQRRFAHSPLLRGRASPPTETPPPATPCACRACFAERYSGVPWYEVPPTFIVCETCGNKRCPHATSHRLSCTHSNAPGQPGSVFA